MRRALALSWVAAVLGVATVALIAFTMRPAHPSSGCMTLAEARASGKGRPRWTYEHRQAGDRRCWYVSAPQLQAVRARHKRNRFRPKPEDDPPAPRATSKPQEPETIRAGASAPPPAPRHQSGAFER